MILNTAQKAAIAAIEKQQPKNRGTVWCCGEQLKDICRREPDSAALIEACREFNVPYELALAVIWQETDYRNVIGDDGNSMGYMQLQPRWVWPEMEELSATDLMDPADNFRVGCCLLGRYIETHGIEGGLTRYNTGSPGWSAYAEEVLEKWEMLKG